MHSFTYKFLLALPNFLFALTQKNNIVLLLAWSLPM